MRIHLRPGAGGEGPASKTWDVWPVMAAVFKPRISYRGQVALFLIPYLLGTLVLVVLPALATVALSLTDYHAVGPPVWVGLDNFRRLAETPLVKLGLYNTLLFAGAAVPLRLLGALVMAFLLGSRRRGSGLYRAAVYLPTIMPEAAYAMVWLWILNPLHGPLNLILEALGLQGPAWLAEPGTARVAMILTALVQIGEGFVVVLAARQNVDPALYEVAEVDGANRWQGFRWITLPLIVPWLLLLLSRDVVMAVQNTFTPSFILTYGGPYYATTFLPLLIYEISFDFADWGLASAILVVTYVWLLLLIWGARNVIEGLRGHAQAD
ncbi:MAG: sugar ABC transporter permease [Anaerolineae bacterium]|nr:sugar ABC transporter permease [Anaerolineae bacterium]